MRRASRWCIRECAEVPHTLRGPPGHAVAAFCLASTRPAPPRPAVSRHRSTSSSSSPRSPRTRATSRASCAATASPLHLVGPARASASTSTACGAPGVDYWHLVDVRQHVDFEHFLHAWAKESPERRSCTSSAPVAAESYLDAAFAAGDALVFGKESVGLPDELLARFPDRVVGIPTLGAVRSLNLANAVGIALYEALRQLGALDETFTG